MKKGFPILLSLILIFILIVPTTFHLFEKQMNENTQSENKQNQGNPIQNQKNNDDLNKPDKTDEDKENNKQNNNDLNSGNDTEENKKNNQVAKYYIDKNYFIKPVNQEDSKKVVLLTFDDSPQGEYTLDILNTLDKYNAKAIFFVNGIYAVKHVDLIKEIDKRGHLIGNHTWSHENLSHLDYDTANEEIIKVDDLIEELIGKRPTYFRPPFGVMSDDARKIILNEKMQSMNWSLGSLDWEYPYPDEAGKVVDQVMSNLKPGVNILMHDKHVTSIALDKILEGIKKEGYSFVLPTEVILNK